MKLLEPASALFNEKLRYKAWKMCAEGYDIFKAASVFMSFHDRSRIPNHIRNSIYQELNNENA